MDRKEYETNQSSFSKNTENQAKLLSSNQESERNFDVLFEEFSKLKLEYHKLNYQHKKILENNQLFLREMERLTNLNKKIKSGKLNPREIVEAHASFEDSLETSQLLKEAIVTDKSANEMIGVFLLGAKDNAKKIVAAAHDQAEIEKQAILEKAVTEAKSIGAQQLLKDEKAHQLMREEISQAKKEADEYVARVKKEIDDYAAESQTTFSEKQKVVALKLDQEKTETANDIKKNKEEADQYYQEKKERADKLYDQEKITAEIEKQKKDARESIDQMKAEADSYISEQKTEAERYAATKKNEADLYVTTAKNEADVYVKNKQDQMLLEEKELQAKIEHLKERFGRQIDVLLETVEEYVESGSDNK